MLWLRPLTRSKATIFIWKSAETKTFSSPTLQHVPRLSSNPFHLISLLQCYSNEHIFDILLAARAHPTERSTLSPYNPVFKLGFYFGDAPCRLFSFWEISGVKERVAFTHACTQNQLQTHTNTHTRHGSMGTEPLDRSNCSWLIWLWGEVDVWRKRAILEILQTKRLP